MCVICVSFEKEKMTYSEALRALRECSSDPIFLREHLDDALNFIDSTEVTRLNTDFEDYVKD